MAWSQVHNTEARWCHPPGERILLCGMSIGYEHVTVEYIRTARAPLHEAVTLFHG
jgi:hypothetical protein